jgi:translation initiation factor 1
MIFLPMSNKNKQRSGIVFSTDPSFSQENFDLDSRETIPPQQQNLKIYLDRMGGGKVVSRINRLYWQRRGLSTIRKITETKMWGGGQR